MPHGDEDVRISRVMDLPQPLKTKQRLAAAIALDGQVLDADLLLRGIAEWRTEAQKHEWQSKQNTWEIEPWLELLPFSTRPEAVLQGLTEVKAFYGTGWDRQWGRVLDGVAALPSPDGERLLLALARQHSDIADDHHWMKAILGRNSIQAALMYLDGYEQGVFGRGPYGVDAWHLGRELVPYIRRFPELKAEFMRRFQAAERNSPAASVFEYLFREVADGNDLLALVHKYATEGRQFNGLMREAVRSATLEHEPISEGSGSYYIHPASLGQARKALFALLNGTPQQRALASACLVEIDSLRDEYGIAVGDPRHPDISSAKPWPLEAVASSG